MTEVLCKSGSQLARGDCKAACRPKTPVPSSFALTNMKFSAASISIRGAVQSCDGDNFSLLRVHGFSSP